jgi:hypothetical protein
MLSRNNTVSAGARLESDEAPFWASAALVLKRVLAEMPHVGGREGSRLPDCIPAADDEEDDGGRSHQSA